MIETEINNPEPFIRVLDDYQYLDQRCSEISGSSVLGVLDVSRGMRVLRNATFTLALGMRFEEMEKPDGLRVPRLRGAGLGH